MDQADDPGADTAMFRAFVDHGQPADAATPQTDRGLVITIAVVVAVLVALAVLLTMIL